MIETREALRSTGDVHAAVAGSSANPSNRRRATDAASKMDYVK